MMERFYTLTQEKFCLDKEPAIAEEKFSKFNRNIWHGVGAVFLRFSDNHGDSYR